MTGGTGRAWRLDYRGELPLNQNGSDNRWRKRTDRKKWRAIAVGLALGAEPIAVPKRELVRVRITGRIFRRNLMVADRPGDLERLKSVVDGLVESQFLPDDGPRFVEYGPVDEAHGVRGFEITIEEMEHDDDTAARAARRYARCDVIDPLAAAQARARAGRAGKAAARGAGAAGAPGDADGDAARLRRDRAALGR
jgi:hypothetical protein